MKMISKHIAASALILASASCGLMDSLDTTNQNTTEMNEDMGTMVEDVEDMELRTEEMNNSMSDMISTMKDMQETMEGMNQTMEDMNQTMEDMSKTMEDMSSGMDGMKDDITELGTDARQGVSLGIRTQAWDRLVSSKDVDAKLAAASAYHMSFEFQTWKGTDLDTLERRDTLFFDGLAEYFRTIYGYADRNNWSLNVLGKGNEVNVLYALAGTLEKVNANQAIFLKEGQKEASFLSLLKESVVSFKQTNSPDYDIETLPDYIEEAAEFKQLTVYMLNLRHNILSGLVVSKLTRLDKAQNRFSELLKQGRKIFPWRPDMKEYAKSSGLLKRIMYYIEEANSMRDFLCKNAESSDPKDTDAVQMRMFNILKSSINKMIIDDQFVDMIVSGQPNNPELAKDFVKSVINFKESVNMSCEVK